MSSLKVATLLKVSVKDRTKRSADFANAYVNKSKIVY